MGSAFDFNLKDSFDGFTVLHNLHNPFMRLAFPARFAHAIG